MTLNAPTKMVFLIAVIIAALALLGGLGIITALAGYSFWMMTIAFVILAASNILKGM